MDDVGIRLAGDPDPVPGSEGMSFRIDDVLVLADELIAFGWNHIGCCDGGRGALWRSTDGVSWTFVDTSGTDYGDTYHFPIDSAVAPTGELVLVSAIGLGGGQHHLHLERRSDLGRGAG